MQVGNNKVLKAVLKEVHCYIKHFYKKNEAQIG